jgi:hypothetical protein
MLLLFPLGLLNVLAIWLPAPLPWLDSAGMRWED